MKSSYELKTGEPAALFEFGLALVDALPLTPSVLSKAGRAAELLSGKPPEPVRSASPPLASDMPAEEAISVVFQSCFSQFLGNLPVLERGDSIEARGKDAASARWQFAATRMNSVGMNLQ